MANKYLALSAALIAALSLSAVACATNESPDESSAPESEAIAPSEQPDFVANGLWDDGPCDETRSPLKVGLMTVFETAVVSLGDQAFALEAAAEAFNERGGANGACIEVVTCDDQGTLDGSLECVRRMEEAGVAATVNDTGTAGQAEVASAMAELGIPRIANNVTPNDWNDPNSFPIATGTALTLLMPSGLIEAGVEQIGVARIDQPAASAAVGLFDQIYGGQATFDPDIPVPAGTTDYSQFILAAEGAGADGLTLVVGTSESIQIMRAAQQLGSSLLVGSAPLDHKTTSELGPSAEQLVFVQNSLPATSDLPAYEVLRYDLARSGKPELQPERLRSQAVASWIGLYGLIQIARDANLTEFTPASVTAALQAATDVPMLGMFGGEDWTPDLDRQGLFQRAGIDRMGVYRFDPSSDAAGFDGNFVEIAEVSLDETLCGSALGAPEPCE